MAGLLLIPILGWIIDLVIFSLLALTLKKDPCPKCQTTMIPLDTPRAKEILAKKDRDGAFIDM